MRVLLIILGALLGIVALFLFIPARIRLRYVDALEVWAGVGPITLKVLPERPRKRKKTSASKIVKSKKAKKSSKKLTLGRVKAPKLSALLPKNVTLETLLAYARLGREALGGMFRTVRIRHLKLHAVVAADDPACAALAYGGTSAAIHALLPAFEGIINWRRAEMVIDVDFSGNPLVTIDISLSVFPIVLLITGMKIMLKFVKINNESAKTAASAAAAASTASE